MGRLIGTTTEYAFVPGVTFTSSYSYDAASNRKTLTAPDGSTTTYGYDSDNRLNALANSWAGSFGFGYDGLSRRTSLTRPNGLRTSYNYDSLSRLLSVLHQAGSAAVDGASYTYDPAGNRTSKTDYLNGTTSNFSYDPLYQLTQVTQGNVTSESYTYDAVGNRLSSSGVSSYSYNSANELTSTSAGSFTYDNNGNTLSDASGKSYVWDFENRLTQVTVPQTAGGSNVVVFKYDPFGRRVQKSGPSGTTNYLYDGFQAVEEVDSTGNALVRYAVTQDVDDVMTELRAGAASFYEADGLGSTTSLTNSAGTIAGTYSYDAFGNLSASTGGLVNSYRYTAREFDPETSLYYYRARYYDQSIGRFLNEDPIGFEGGSNYYGYALANPLSFVDPEGLSVVPAGGVILPGPDVMKMLECIDRCYSKNDVIITSGARTPDRNRAVGGRRRSYHLLGMAADIFVPGQTPEETAMQASFCGARGISPYDSDHGGHTHVDVRPNVWNGYNGDTLPTKPWWRNPHNPFLPPGSRKECDKCQ